MRGTGEPTTVRLRFHSTVTLLCLSFLSKRRAEHAGAFCCADSFQALDADRSGALDIGELAKLGQQLKLKWTASQLKQAFKDMILLAPVENDKDDMAPGPEGVKFEGN